jgi:hypothetical protein
MAPERFYAYTLFLAAPTLLGALLLEYTVFWWCRAFRWSSVWLFIGVPYGLFWSCYGLLSVIDSARVALLAALLGAVAGVLLVRLVAIWLATRIGR